MAAGSSGRRNGPLFYAVCILAGLLMAGLSFRSTYQRVLRGENDFMQLYAGARLAGTPDLYNIEADKAIHRELFGTYYPSVYYTRLPFYALLLSPLAKLPYLAAYWIFQIVSLCVVGLFLYLYSGLYKELPLLACLSLPLLLSFINGQDSGIMAALAGFAVLLMRRGKDFPAGLLLSLGAIKIHLLVLVPVVLLVRKRWKVLEGGMAGGAVLLALSFLAGGRYWLRDFLALIANPELHPKPGSMASFRTLVYNLMGREDRWLELALSVALTALLVYLAVRIESFDVVFGLSLAGGLLVCFHAYSQDLSMLLAAFAIFVTAEASAPLKAAALIAILPPTALAQLSGPPWSTAVSLLILSILVTALVDAHAGKVRATAGIAAS